MIKNKKSSVLFIIYNLKLAISCDTVPDNVSRIFIEVASPFV
jgi:hypothetical protein